MGNHGYRLVPMGTLGIVHIPHGQNSEYRLVPMDELRNVMYLSTHTVCSIEVYVVLNLSLTYIQIA